jgi:hypothetical protein
MQRKHMIVAGSILILLLLAGALGFFLLQGPGGAKQPSPVQALRGDAGDTEVMLTWQAMPEARGYFVYRDGSDVALNIVPLANTQYDDVGLTNGKSYTYSVAPADVDGLAGNHSAAITVAPKSN